MKKKQQLWFVWGTVFSLTSLQSCDDSDQGQFNNSPEKAQHKKALKQEDQKPLKNGSSSTEEKSSSSPVNLSAFLNVPLKSLIVRNGSKKSSPPLKKCAYEPQESSPLSPLSPPLNISNLKWSGKISSPFFSDKTQQKPLFMGPLSYNKNKNTFVFSFSSEKRRLSGEGILPRTFSKLKLSVGKKNITWSSSTEPLIKQLTVDHTNLTYLDFSWENHETSNIPHAIELRLLITPGNKSLVCKFPKNQLDGRIELDRFSLDNANSEIYVATNLISQQKLKFETSDSVDFISSDWRGLLLNIR